MGKVRYVAIALLLLGAGCGSPAANEAEQAMSAVRDSVVFGGGFTPATEAEIRFREDWWSDGCDVTDLSQELFRGPRPGAFEIPDSYPLDAATGVVLAVESHATNTRLWEGGYASGAFGEASKYVSEQSIEWATAGEYGRVSLYRGELAEIFIRTWGPGCEHPEFLGAGEPTDRYVLVENFSTDFLFNH